MSVRLRMVMVSASALWAVLILAGSGWAAPGDLDRAFGKDGIALPRFEPSSGVFALRADGNSIFAAAGPSGDGSELLLSRFGLDGRRHAGFGLRRGPGTFRFETAVGIVTRTGESVTVALAASNGGFELTGPGSLILVRFRWDGSRDMTFGDGGQVAYRGVNPAGVAADRSGRLLVIAYRQKNERENVADPVLLRFLANGDPDPAFGDDGAVVLPERFRLSSLVVAPDDSALVSGLITSADFASDRSSTPAVERFDAQGRPDPSFTPIRAPAERNVGNSDTFLLLSDGRERLVTAIAKGLVTTVARYSRAGTPDTNFGAQGIVNVPRVYATDLDLDDGDSLVLTGVTQDGGRSVTQLARLTSRGRLDETFGRRGYVRPMLQAAQETKPLLSPDGHGGLLIAGVEPADANARGAFARYEAGGIILAKVSTRGLLRQDTGRLRLFLRNTGSRSVPVQLDSYQRRGKALVRLAPPVSRTLPAHAKREVVLKPTKAAARTLATRHHPHIVVKLRSNDRFGNRKASETRVAVTRRG